MTRTWAFWFAWSNDKMHDGGSKWQALLPLEPEKVSYHRTVDSYATYARFDGLLMQQLRQQVTGENFQQRVHFEALRETNLLLSPFIEEASVPYAWRPKEKPLHYERRFESIEDADRFAQWMFELMQTWPADMVSRIPRIGDQPLFWLWNMRGIRPEPEWDYRGAHPRFLRMVARRYKSMTGEKPYFSASWAWRHNSPDELNDLFNGKEMPLSLRHPNNACLWPGRWQGNEPTPRIRLPNEGEPFKAHYRLGGKLFKLNLRKALAAGKRDVVVVSLNDYTEGHQIWPCEDVVHRAEDGTLIDRWGRWWVPEDSWRYLRICKKEIGRARR